MTVDLLGIGLLSIVICVAALLPLFAGKSWSSPVFILAGWTLVFILGDAIYTHIAGSYGPSDVVRFHLLRGETASATFLWSLGILAFIGAYYLPVVFAARHSPQLNMNCPAAGTAATRIAVLIGTVLTGGSLLTILVAAQAKGYGFTKIALHRNEWFGNGGGLRYLGTQSFKAAVMLYCFVAFSRKKKSLWSVAFLILAVTGIDLLLGSRSAWAYGFILPLLIGYHRLVKRIPLWVLGSLVLAIFLLAGVLYRSVTRDQYFFRYKQNSLIEVLGRNYRDLPGYFWGGYEATSFDGTIDVLRHEESFHLLPGQTLACALAAPVPRVIWKGKPSGGGNAEYTRRLYPVYYDKGGSEYSISFVGELFINFGIPGILMGFALVGFLSGAGKGLLDSTHYPAVPFLFYSVFICRLLSLWRGDLFNFTNQLLVTYANLILLIAVSLIVNAFWDVTVEAYAANHATRQD